MPEAGRRRVLVVGGTGAFGSRLVRGLVAHSDFAVTIAARDLPRARAFAAELGGGDRVATVRLDVAGVDAAALRAAGAFAVVDAAGPFQDGELGLVRAAIAAGLHYVDLADARDWVSAIGRFDAAAQAAGVALLAGASSTPALSHAVLDVMTRGWRTVDRIEVAIVPGNRAPRGLSVVRSILSYAGLPVRLWLDGRWQDRPGWGLTVRRDIPGLGRRWLSLCETPDLDLLPARFAVGRTAVFRAGLELPILHLGLLAASLPVRLLPRLSLAPLARPVRAVADCLMPFGTDRGGMLVEAAGGDEAGAPVEAAWSLLAEAGDGPVIPTLPALAALRLLAAGALPAGARSAAGVLPLRDIAAEFAPYRITTRLEVRPAGGDGVFATTLGEAFARLPAPIRAVHDGACWRVLAGEARVEGAASWPARMVARLFGFPPATPHVAVRVTIAAEGGREIWTRQFGAHRFRSTLAAGVTRGAVTERFGPFVFTLRLTATPETLTYEVMRWRFLGLPLPSGLAPRSLAVEGVDASGRFTFDVPIALPFIGNLVRYQGWLLPQA